MTERNLPADIVERLRAITSKRPKTVIEHILAHGFITTEDLKTRYGYNHPPRAARDVREQGVPLETFSVTGTDGRNIAAYRFGDLTQIVASRLGGRRTFPKPFKDLLVQTYGSRCAICNTPYEERYLQIDHRVPYGVVGDTRDALLIDDYMLLCGSCNRAKSWSCEHCDNWLKIKNPDICHTCYWASPQSYKHIALREVRRLDVVWTEDETVIFEKLKRRADVGNEPLPDYVKAIVKDYLQEE